MQDARTLPFLRDDTMLGVCEAIGRDFGVPPTVLRLAIAPLLVWQPVNAILIYCALGAVVNLACWLFRQPKPASPAATTPAPATDQDLDAIAFAEAA